MLSFAPRRPLPESPTVIGPATLKMLLSLRETPREEPALLPIRNLVSAALTVVLRRPEIIRPPLPESPTVPSAAPRRETNSFLLD